jgi:site-specific DNA recombinase
MDIRPETVGYVRVSDTSQLQGFSLPAQERFITDYCRLHNWELIKIYREEGKSAHIEDISKRPVFQQLLEDASQRRFQRIIVHSQDRWSRILRVTLNSISTLDKFGVSLVSINENIDYSTPSGKLAFQIMGSFAEYTSDAISFHTRKGLSQRANAGKHNGCIPFGYESCWIEKNGEKKCRCDPVHSGGIHIHPQEGPAVAELFRHYSCGSTSLAVEAAWLNEQGLRTHNMHRLLDAHGNLVSGPKLFTTASIRGILHNPFYTGKVKFNGMILNGVHESLINQDTFDLVQSILRRNSGRSKTLQAHPARHYLLKGLIRCPYCGMPMWAQTYKSGRSYYREHRHSRSLASCPTSGGAISCNVPDYQIDQLISSIELGPQWLEEVLAIINMKDETERIQKRKYALQERLKRIGKVYLDKLISDEDYSRQIRLAKEEIESLVVPEVNAVEEAGKLVKQLPELWACANVEEKRKLLLTMLEAVYFDAKQSRSIVAVKPRPSFRSIFEVAAMKEGSGIRILNKSQKIQLRDSSVFLVETGEG